MTSTHDLTFMLNDLIAAVPHSRSAVVLASDGMAKYFTGLDASEAAVIAAAASGMGSLAKGLSPQSSTARGLRQVAVEWDDSITLLLSVNPTTLLLVTADREVDLGVLGYKMNQLSAQIPEALETPDRHGGRVVEDRVRHA